MTNPAAGVTKPVGGTPPVGFGTMPTLLPNFDEPVFDGSVVELDSPYTFLQNNPRIYAQATATLGGSVSNGDILTIEITNPILPGGVVSESITAGSTDTLFSLAAAFAKAFNDNLTCQQFGIEVDAVQAVLTFSWPGPVGNFAVLVAPTEEVSTITAGGTALTGDEIYIQFAGAGIGATPIIIKVAATTGNTTTQTATAIKNAINASSALGALSITATSSLAVVSVTVPATAEPCIITGWVNVGSPTAVIGGSVAAGGGDQLELIFTCTAIAGSPLTVSYTTIAGDTTATIAAALAAAIMATPALQSAGVTASASSSTITIVDPGNIGQLRISKSIPTGSETITLAATPTDTVSIGTAATETITFTPSSGDLSGGSGPIVPYNNFQYTPPNGGVMNFRAGIPIIVDNPTVTALVNDVEPIV